MKPYYFISNSDNKIYKTSNVKCNIKETLNGIVIEILSDEDEVIDTVDAHETLGDLMESLNEGGNDLE